MIEPRTAAERMCPHRPPGSGRRRLAAYCAIAAVIAVFAMAGAVQDTGEATEESPKNPTTAPVHVVAVDGPLDSINRRFLEERIEDAATRNAQALLVQLNSPGFLRGGWKEARDLAERVKASPVPIVVWVGPAGATAERGAFWIYFAAHLRGASPLSRAGEAVPLD